VPARPHPNCHCWVEIIEDYDENKNESEEPCDCLFRLEEWLNECEYACSEAETIENSMANNKEEINNIINYVSSYPLNAFSELLFEAEDLISNTVETLSDLLSQIVESINIFRNNYNDLVNLKKEVGHYVNWSAEYYHTNANCQAAQLGDAGEKAAITLGYIRELGDFPKEILTKGQSVKQAFNNSIHDLKVNEEGRKIGRENPYGDCGEIIKGRINVDWPQKY
jgi:hypothetical protein